MLVAGCMVVGWPRRSGGNPRRRRAKREPLKPSAYSPRRELSPNARRDVRFGRQTAFLLKDPARPGIIPGDIYAVTMRAPKLDQPTRDAPPVSGVLRPPVAPRRRAADGARPMTLRAHRPGV